MINKIAYRRMQITKLVAVFFALSIFLTNFSVVLAEDVLSQAIPNPESEDGSQLNIPRWEPPKWNRELILKNNVQYLETKDLVEGGLENLTEINGVQIQKGYFRCCSKYINNKGQIAIGRFIWNLGEWITIPALPGGLDADIFARGINNKGEVVGSASSPARGDIESTLTHAFLWSDGKMKDIGALFGKYIESTAVDLNNKGQVIGSYFDPSSSAYRAFLWSKNGVTDLGRFSSDYFLVLPTAINDLGQVIGSAESIDGTRKMFLWEKDKMKELNIDVLPSVDGIRYSAVDINNKGQIIGNYWFQTDKETLAGRYGAFLWENGITRNLGDGLTVSAINNRGKIVGTGFEPGFGQYGFVWEKGEIIRLYDLLSDDDISKRDFDGPLSINDKGQIVGNVLLKLPANIIKMLK